jgi:hypothetical protein
MSTDCNRWLGDEEAEEDGLGRTGLSYCSLDDRRGVKVVWRGLLETVLRHFVAGDSISSSSSYGLAAALLSSTESGRGCDDGSGVGIEATSRFRNCRPSAALKLTLANLSCTLREFSLFKGDEDGRGLNCRRVCAFRAGAMSSLLSGGFAGAWRGKTVS